MSGRDEEREVEAVTRAEERGWGRGWDEYVEEIARTHRARVDAAAEYASWFPPPPGSAA